MNTEQRELIADAIIEVANEEGGSIITDDMAHNSEAIRKLNERLGVTDKESLFSFDELKKIQQLIDESRQDFVKFSEEIAAKKEAVNNAEAAATEIMGNGVTGASQMQLKKASSAIATFEDALGSITDLVGTGQAIIDKLYSAIASTDLIDSDIIEATAKVIEGVRISVSDIITFNTNKMNLEHQYKMAVDTEMLKQKNRMELEAFKSKLRIDEAKVKSQLKIEEKKALGTIEGDDNSNSTNNGTFSWSYTEALAAVNENSRIDESH